MTLIQSINELRQWRRNCGHVVLVPTMGALHEGHLALVREARALAGEHGQVAVSIFVNPLQFGPNEDLDRYPRTLEKDLAGCAEAGADVVFAPSAAEVYFPDRSISVSESSLSTGLCGASRPGHFDGVCTVVAKLFNLFQPDEAVFGKKDYQQLAIIRRMVRDLNFPITIHGLETVREADGLAMSSRNQYLNEEERAQAPALQAALLVLRDAWLDGTTGATKLKQFVTTHLQKNAPLSKLDYLEVVDAETLEPLTVTQKNRSAVALAAVFFGKTRLIDNIKLPTT